MNKTFSKSNVDRIKESDVYVISFPDKAEIFIANKNRYASSMLNLEQLKALRKSISDEIIKLTFNNNDHN